MFKVSNILVSKIRSINDRRITKERRNGQSGYSFFRWFCINFALKILRKGKTTSLLTLIYRLNNRVDRGFELLRKEELNL